MTVLGMNTVENITSVAIIEDSKMLGGMYTTNRNKCASMLVPYIDHALSQADKTIKEVDLISICAGPGSYTSLRIGYSTAKTLCIVNGIKFAEVSRFRLMANKFVEYYDLNLGIKANTTNEDVKAEDVKITVTLPTTYGKVMTQTYIYANSSSNGEIPNMREVSTPSIVPMSDVINSHHSENSFLVGDFRDHKKANDFKTITTSKNYF